MPMRRIGLFFILGWLMAGCESKPSSTGALAQPKPGQILYQEQCASCHGWNGDGVAGQHPPLVKNDWVTSSPGRLIRIMLHGVRGERKIAGEIYNGTMQSFRQLHDEEIADVLNYIRTSWGNQGAAITGDDVKLLRLFTAERQEPWTAEELQQPLNRSIPGMAGW